jgi:prefoldin subunit 5
LDTPDARIEAMQKKIDELQQRIERLESAAKNRS